MTDETTLPREDTMLYREPTPESEAVQDIWGKKLETRVVGHSENRLRRDNNSDEIGYVCAQASSIKRTIFLCGRHERVEAPTPPSRPEPTG